MSKPSRGQLKTIQSGCHAPIAGVTPAYGYVPGLAPGVVFCVLFGLSMAGHLFRSVQKRRWTSYVLVAGALTEVLGWAGRTWSSQCSLNQNAFLMQITTLIIAPVFFSAAAYITLGALIRIVGRSSSILSPRMYVIIFSTADVVSLVVQAIGGGSASVASSRGTNTKPGTNIMVAGILFQLVTMVVFVGFMLDFLRRAIKMEKPGNTNKVILAMSLSILTIFIRSVYRSIELLQGWRGYLITHERFFLALDGVMMILAVGIYNVVDPAVLLPKVHVAEAVGGEKEEVRDVDGHGEEMEVKSSIGGDLESSNGRRSV